MLDRDVLPDVALILANLSLERSQILNGVQAHVRSGRRRWLWLLQVVSVLLGRVLLGIDDTGHDQLLTSDVVVRVRVVITQQTAHGVSIVREALHRLGLEGLERGRLIVLLDAE